MALRGTQPVSYITEYTLVYEEESLRSPMLCGQGGRQNPSITAICSTFTQKPWYRRLHKNLGVLCVTFDTVDTKILSTVTAKTSPVATLVITDYGQLTVLSNLCSRATSINGRSCHPHKKDGVGTILRTGLVFAPKLTDLYHTPSRST